MDRRKLHFSIIILIFYTAGILAFQNTAVKQSVDYKTIHKKYDDYRIKGDTVNAQEYGQKYLLAAKNDGDSIRIGRGYYFLSRISDFDETLAYSDSIIAITKNKPTKYLPALAYRAKSIIYDGKGNFKKAFDMNVLISEIAKDNNLYLFHDSTREIATFKTHIGEHKTALKILRKCYDYFQKTREKGPFEYLSTLIALSDSYTHNKKLDSATIINRLGYKESLLLNDENYKDYFTLYEGVNQYHKGNYEAARDSLQKVRIKLEEYADLANVGLAHFYLGKSLSALNNHDQAIAEHQKVDLIFKESPRLIPECRESYEILIEHYKKIGDKDNQLKYIERLMEVRSVLESNYEYLIKSMAKNYDTPKLLAKKQEIIDSLEGDKKSSVQMISILSGISIIFLVFLIYNYQKRRTYKKRFDALYATTTKDGEVQKLQDVQEHGNIGISEDVVNDILEKLDTFEQNLKFLQSDITTNSLAKSFNTNSKYLSKVVNTYKKKSFSAYINDLRIDYSITKLKDDRKFKNYTMQAIAREIGFNTPQAFSKSFFKKNGIHPSYFIKQLEKHHS